MIIARLLKSFLPQNAFDFFKELYWKDKGILLYRRISCYFRNHPKMNKYSAELAFYQTQGGIFTPFPYAIMNDEYATPATAFFDEENQMTYVIHKGKRLYFPFDNVNDAVSCYKRIRAEQHCDSPHCYVTNKFAVMKGDVIYDVGCADGMFALEHAEIASEIFLFECESNWIKALQATFAPYIHKTHIIHKLVTDTNNGRNVRLDGFIKPSTSVFIKIDVEGYEKQVLIGMGNSLTECRAKIVCCTYHRQNDAFELGGVLEVIGMTIEYSKGYMLYYYGKKLCPPYFRHGLIRARNDCL